MTRPTVNGHPLSHYSGLFLYDEFNTNWSKLVKWLIPLGFDTSHLSYFDQKQLLTNGDQLWPLIWPSMTKILFRVLFSTRIKLDWKFEPICISIIVDVGISKQEGQELVYMPLEIVYAVDIGGTD